MCYLSAEHTEEEQQMRYPVTIALIIALAGLYGCPPTPPPPDLQPQVEDSPADWPRTFTDALGETVTLQAPPQRVISLSTGFAETIFTIGAGDRLVGRTDFVDHPPEILQVPTVGGMINPSLEAIAALEPDLVLTVHGTPHDVVEGVRRTCVPVIARDPVTVAEVLECTRDIGRYLGIEQEADALADDLEARRDAVAEGAWDVARQGRPSVLFVIDLDNVFVAGAGHFVDDMIQIAGGVNAATLAAGEAAGQWPSLSLEAVVALDPDIIIMALEDDRGEVVDGAALLRQRPAWRDLSAVRGDRVYNIDPDLTSRAGPRLFDALEQIAGIVSDAVGGGSSDG